MTKSELKKQLKPLIKQCIKEVLIEEGTLSTLIAEVIVGLNASPLIAESTPAPTREPEPEVKNKRPKQLEVARKKMMEAIGKDAYGGIDLFEGTRPLKTSGAPTSPASPHSPLAHVDPDDPGVDITKLMPGMDKIWKKLM